MSKLLNLVKAGVIASAIAVLGTPAQAAYIIGGTDVGQLDTALGGIASAQSGQAYEEAQLEAACSCSLTLLANINSFTMVTSGTDHYIDVNPATPGYYLLKFGTGNTGNDMFFMRNETFLGYLAWSDGMLTALGLPTNHVLSLSHYALSTSIGSSSSSSSSSSSGTPPGSAVPAPGTAGLALLGVAMIGAGLFTRRRNASR